MISLEFGHVYARAGADVTILEALPQLLPAMDADAVARIQTESERIGIQVRTGVSVKRIERANNRLRVIFTHEGVETRRRGRSHRQRRRARGQCRYAGSGGRQCRPQQRPRGRGSVPALDLQPSGLCLRRRGADFAAALADRDLRGRHRRPQHRRRTEIQPRLRQHGDLGLHRSGARRGRPDRGRRESEGFRDQGSHQ